MKKQLISNRIREAMEEKGVTQASLSRLTGLPAGTISRYANGRRNPNAEVLGKVASALGVSCDYLIGMNGGDDGRS